MDNEIGQRLKSIRTQLNLSQRQLARQSGVANATISQVEAGKLNPTVSMLKKVLDGIPVSLGEFFGAEFEAPYPVHQRLRSDFAAMYQYLIPPTALHSECSG